MSEDGKSNSTSIKDIYNNVKNIYDSYTSFSIKDNVKLIRLEINNKLSSIPLKTLNEPTKEIFNVANAHLLYTSNYLHEKYPYTATLSRSHGYLISGAFVLSLALSPLRSNIINFLIYSFYWYYYLLLLLGLPKIIYRPLLFTTLISSILGVKIINYKVDYPSNKAEFKKSG